MYYEDKDKDTLFTIYLSNPSGGVEIGNIDLVKIYYFDNEEELLDAHFSTALING